VDIGGNNRSGITMYEFGHETFRARVLAPSSGTRILPKSLQVLEYPKGHSSHYRVYHTLSNQDPSRDISTLLNLTIFGIYAIHAFCRTLKATRFHPDWRPIYIMATGGAGSSGLPALSSGVFTRITASTIITATPTR
jgi:hypothetical protein